MLNLDSTRILSFQAVKNLKPEESQSSRFDAIYTQKASELTKQNRARFNRHIPTQPDKILDAPGIKNDFYLNCLDWNQDNIIAISLDNEVSSLPLYTIYLVLLESIHPLDILMEC